MRVNEFSSSLYEEMDKRLSEINRMEKDTLQISKDSSAIILKFIYRLKEYINNYKFDSPAEEIDFFKNIKPKFLSKLIYYQKVFIIQAGAPVGTLQDLQNYYLGELRKIRTWFHKNIEFLIYHRSNAHFFDDIYFIRKDPDLWLLLHFEDYETDLSFTTIYDHKVSKIIAFELLSAFIKNAIDKLEAQPVFTNIQNPGNTAQVNWTGSKVSLVELLYALQSAGSCNHGKIDLRQLANHLEHLFNIELGNYYRIFQEMRIRKINRTSFLDQLKDRLLQRMDETDENPRFK